MRFSTFLKDKWIFLLSQTGIVLFLALLLNVMKISNAANAFICICVLFITVGALVLEYNQKNGFYRELYRNLGTLEKKYYISSITEKPRFVEGAILMDVLRQTTKSMNDDIADYRRMNAVYQDYIETWIHEIKIPISCINLIYENNKGEMASSVKEELSRIDGYVEQDHVLLYVSDDGIGIPESELPRIFEKGFTRTNGRSYAKSTGVGLCLCRQLCNKMHLSIAAYSVSGQGTTMQITFPKDSRLLLE